MATMIKRLRVNVGSNSPGQRESSHENENESHDSIASTVIGHNNTTCGIIDVGIHLEHGASNEHADTHDNGTENEEELATPFVDEHQANKCSNKRDDASTTRCSN